MAEMPEAGRRAQIDRHPVRLLVPDAGQDPFSGGHRCVFLRSLRLGIGPVRVVSACTAARL